MKPKIEKVVAKKLWLVVCGFCFGSALVIWVNHGFTLTDGWFSACCGWGTALIMEFDKHSAILFTNKVIAETNRRNGHHES